MTKPILVYLSCPNKKRAEEIGEQLLSKRLVACFSVLDGIKSQFFWPPKSKAIDSARETVLLAKTLETKWKAIEKLVHKLHSDEVPDLLAIPIRNISQKYYNWLKGELII